MRRITLLISALTLCFTTGCTNFLYQGEITAKDAYGKDRHFVLYWTKKDPFIGTASAGPAMLLTECSPTKLSFDEQPAGLIFRSTSEFDRLVARSAAVDPNLICGKVTNYTRWTEAKEGTLSLAIFCEPVPNEFATQPRNYLAVSPQPYVFPIVEQLKKWSFFGETLPGPPAPECRSN